ncbi:hypothetical protein, partial [Burkholderia sp. Cy-647]
RGGRARPHRRPAGREARLGTNRTTNPGRARRDAAELRAGVDLCGHLARRDGVASGCVALVCVLAWFPVALVCADTELVGLFLVGLIVLVARRFVTLVCAVMVLVELRVGLFLIELLVLVFERLVALVCAVAILVELFVRLLLVVEFVLVFVVEILVVGIEPLQPSLKPRLPQTTRPAPSRRGPCRSRTGRMSPGSRVQTAIGAVNGAWCR